MFYLVPAQSQAQQKFFALVRGIQTGKIKIDDLPEGVREKVKAAAKSMTKQDVKDFASTPSKNLPKQVGESSYSVGSYLTFVRLLKESLTEVEIRLLCGEVLMESPKLDQMLLDFIHLADDFVEGHLRAQSMRAYLGPIEVLRDPKIKCRTIDGVTTCIDQVTGKQVPVPQRFKESIDTPVLSSSPTKKSSGVSEGLMSWLGFKKPGAPDEKKTFGVTIKDYDAHISMMKALRLRVIEAANKLAPYFWEQKEYYRAFINKHAIRSTQVNGILERISRGEDIYVIEN